MTRLFAKRRLSPFQGYIQVLEAGDGHASSSNGIDWRIKIKIESAEGLQSILFGFWSSEGGFHRVPLPPMVSSEAIEIAAQPIIDELLATTRQVPFKQVDQCELWLLDEKDQLPLALIASASKPDRLPTVRHLTWQATVATDHSFTRTWSRGQTQANDSDRDELNTLIYMTAGDTPMAQWFVRTEEGAGKGIDGFNLDNNIKQRELEKEAFPELLLRETWPDEKSQQLVQEYLAWQAPFLLTLPDLNPITRKRLEIEAFKQPFKVEGQHKLWPEVIDKEKLKATLVEAQMRRSNPNAGDDN